MQHDEVIWQVINQGFCSFKAKTNTQTFCRNEYNLTGLCNRTSCPLANSQYATILEKDGRLYLHMKTIERAHMPSKLWEKVQLSEELRGSAQADRRAPRVLAADCRPQVQAKADQDDAVPHPDAADAVETRKTLERVHKKVDVRDARREVKAEKAARIDKAIETELLERLKGGTYGDIYNFPMAEYEKALDREGAEEDQELGGEEDEDEEGFGDAGEFVAADEDDEDDEEEWEEEDAMEANAADWARGKRSYAKDEDEDEDDEDDEDDGEEDDDEEERLAAEEAAAAAKAAAAAAAKARKESKRPRDKKPGAKGGASADSSVKKKRRRREVEYEEERESSRSQQVAVENDW